MVTIIIKFLLVLIFYLIIPQESNSGDNIPSDKFIAAKIPAELLINANAVIRYDSRYFRVESIKSAIEKIHRVVTILNSEGQNYGAFEIGYDKFEKIKNIDGKIYNAEGKIIRSMKSDDIADRSGTSIYSLYEDSKIKSVVLIHNTFPYTVEYEYEIAYQGYISWPPWYLEEINASVEYSKYEVMIPAEQKLRYWKNIDIEPIIENNEKTCVYRWEAVSLLPFEEEPVGPALGDQLKGVRIAPDQFEIDGYAGNLSTWKSFGEWKHNLYLNRQALPEKERQKILSLTSGISDDKEKTRKIYEYMQLKTRYVSIQLGIGGWQPFDANYVCEKGYGDCKALTNYMMSLLRVVNISAYPALIYTDDMPRMSLKDFPSNQFNHVILFVPLKEDTIWLECTSRYSSFGRIGFNNENRFALIITPQGGKLIQTPSSKALDNCLVRSAKLDIDPSGKGTAVVRATYTGNRQDNIVHTLKEATPKEREDWLRENIQIPTFSLKTADFSQIDSKSDPVNLNFSLDLPRYLTVTGNRVLLQPNLLNRRSYVPKALEKRKQPVVISYSYSNLDTIFIKRPASLVIEATPKPVIIERPWGKYSSSIIPLDKETLLYLRYFEMSASELPPESYSDYRSFLQQVVQADKANIVFNRK